MQRLQVGLFGLGVMVLLVGLASIIMTNARRNQDRDAVQVSSTAASDSASEAGNDPLADAGVVPVMPDAATARPDARAASGR